MEHSIREERTVKKTISPAATVIIIVVVIAIIALIGWKFLAGKGKGASQGPPVPESELKEKMLKGGSSTGAPTGPPAGGGYGGTHPGPGPGGGK
jgi:hypothetical protein